MGSERQAAQREAAGGPLGRGLDVSLVRARAEAHEGRASPAGKNFVERSTAAEVHAAQELPRHGERAQGFPRFNGIGGKAMSFEKYLKVGSGHAFAQRRFW